MHARVLTARARSRTTSTRARFAALAEALLVCGVVTGLVVLAARVVPEGWIATVVGFLFLGATWAFVWRRDDPWVRDRGLALGGLVLPSEPRPLAWIAAGLGALAWAAAMALLTFVPFYFGFRTWTALHDAHMFGEPVGMVPGTSNPISLFFKTLSTDVQTSYLALKSGSVEFQRTFVFPFTARALAERILGQTILVALPEEAFYRGYLQSRFTDVFPPRRRIFGAPFGIAILLTSVLFACGHLATIPAVTRLAVFFPSLLFGWLRSRTKGIGAGLAYHAACNVFSELLVRGYLH